MKKTCCRGFSAQFFVTRWLIHDWHLFTGMERRRKGHFEAAVDVIDTKPWPDPHGPTHGMTVMWQRLKTWYAAETKRTSCLITGGVSESRLSSSFQYWNAYLTRRLSILTWLSRFLLLFWCCAVFSLHRANLLNLWIVVSFQSCWFLLFSRRFSLAFPFVRDRVLFTVHSGFLFLLL